MSPASKRDSFEEEANLDERESGNSYFAPGSDGSGSYNRSTFDSGTPRDSYASSQLSYVERERQSSDVDSMIRGFDSERERHSSGVDMNGFDEFRERHSSNAMLGFDAPEPAAKPDEPKQASPKENAGPQYFDTDSERGSSVGSDRPGDERDSYTDTTDSRRGGSVIGKAAGWRPGNMLNRLASEKLNQVLDKRSSSSKNSSNANSSNASSPSDGKKSRTRGLSSLLSRKPPVPTSRLRKESNSSSVQSFESEIEESYLYSPPTNDKPKNSSKFGGMLGAVAAAKQVGIPKRFGWNRGAKKSGGSNSSGTNAA